MGYYDRQGNPLTPEEAVTPKYFDMEARRVALDEIGGYRISTVHLVNDHNYGDGPPLIFETMVFRDTADGDDIDMRRYCTEAEAIAGHADVLNEVRLIVEALGGGEPA